jgi:aminopeptidase N
VGGQPDRAVARAAVEYLTPVPTRSLSYGSASLGDEYLPTTGNGGYTVEHYDLDLDYRVATNRLAATAVITARATMRLVRFSLDFAGLTVEKVTVDGERPRKTTHAGRKLTVTLDAAVEDGDEFEVTVRYRGAPRPIRGRWGELGWEELTDGVLVASQPNGAASWFPCNDHPSDKATYRIQVACESSYRVLANGELVSRSDRSGRTTWVFDTLEPMASYLATVQIGRYTSSQLGTVPVVQTAHFPPSLAPVVAVDFARLGDMFALFCDRFGPYPFPSYSVVVTADDLEIPLEAQGLAVFGRNHIDGAHSSDRLIAHELAHQWFGNSLTITRWRDIWLHEGFACYSEWLWAEESGGPSIGTSVAEHHRVVGALPKDIVVGDPGPAKMFDDRIYKRGALAVHAVRGQLGDRRFFEALRAFVAAHRHAGISTAGFVSFFAGYADEGVIEQLVDRWVFGTALPPL